MFLRKKSKALNQFGVIQRHYFSKKKGSKIASKKRTVEIIFPLLSRFNILNSGRNLSDNSQDMQKKCQELLF